MHTTQGEFTGSRLISPRIILERCGIPVRSNATDEILKKNKLWIREGSMVVVLVPYGDRGAMT